MVTAKKLIRIAAYVYWTAVIGRPKKNFYQTIHVGIVTIIIIFRYYFLPPQCFSLIILLLSRKYRNIYLHKNYLIGTEFDVQVKRVSLKSENCSAKF